MCGIVGMAGQIQNREKDAFQDLLIYSQVRGPHSTGVASVSRSADMDTKMAKAIGRPDMLIDYDKRYDRVVDYNKQFMLGHNRYATQGKVNVKNAHPFNFENIVGCHNGTIPEYRLRDLKRDFSGYGTDSEAVLSCIDDTPLQEIFRSLSGAWAFVWFDRRNRTVNFLRNDDRYLCYCYSEDRKTIFWASEKGFLDSALGRNKIAYSTVYEVTADMHTRWEVPEMNKPFEKSRQSKILSNQWAAPQGNRFPADNTDDQTESRTGFVSSSSGASGGSAMQMHAGAKADIIRSGGNVYDIKTKKVKAFEGSSNLPNLDGQGYLKKRGNKDVYRGFRGETLNKHQFMEATKGDCCWCDSTSEWGQPVRFLTKDTYICLECSEDQTVREICGVKGK